MVVAAGTTVVQPVAGTVPTSWLMETVLALATAQFRVILSPSVIEFLLAEKVFIEGGVFTIAVSAVFVVPDVSTVTVMDLVTEP